MTTALAAPPPSITDTGPPPGRYELARCVTDVSVRHSGVARVRGRLEAVGGALVVGRRLADSWARVDVDSRSLTTGDAERDEVLRGPWFLAADEFPVVRVETTSIESRRSGYAAWADLYVRDMVGEVRLDARIAAMSDERVAVAIRASFSRRAFDLRWAGAIERFGVVIADAVHLDVAAEFVR